MELTGPKLKRLSDGEHGDGGGLYVRLKGGTGSWRYRYKIRGRRRVMGLGSYPQISLTEARALRDPAANLKAAGFDPLEERKSIHSMTVREAVASAFEALKGDLRDDGNAG